VTDRSPSAPRLAARVIFPETAPEEHLARVSGDLCERLREQESMLAYAHIIARDPEDHITFWSALDEELYGWAAPEALGRKCGELLRTELPAPREELEMKARTDGRWEGEIVHYHRDGQRRVLATTWAPYREAGGDFVAMIEMNCDITRQKLAEQETRARERDFRTFFELNGAGNVLADFQSGRFLRVNETFCQMTGYTTGELLQLSAFDVTHPDDRERDAEGWERSLAEQQKHYTIEKRYLRKDGSAVWVSVTSTVIADDESGRVSQHNAFHNTLKLYFHGLLSLLPGDEATPVYIVTGRFVADALFALMRPPVGTGIYHVSHEAKDSPTLGALISRVFDTFEQDDGFRRRRVLRPVYASERSFTDLAEGVESFGGEVVKQALRSMTPFARQLYVRKEFGNRRAREILKDYAPEHSDPLIDRVSRHLISTRWGRQQAAG